MLLLPNPPRTRPFFQGYLEFYIETKNRRRIPFYILSIGNAIMLPILTNPNQGNAILMIVVMILHDLCDSNDNNCIHAFSKVEEAVKS